MVLQARLSSQRLPKKVLRPFLNEQPLLHYILTRLRDLPEEIPVVVATSTNKEDDAIAEATLRQGFPTHRGSLTNVLERYVETCNRLGFQYVVRLTADNPFVDPALIQQFLKIWYSGNFDYISNKIGKGYPIGSDIEIVRVKALEHVLSLNPSIEEKEHVTSAIYKAGAEQYKIAAINRKEDDLSSVRMTIDVPLDFVRAQAVAKRIDNSVDQSWSAAAQAFLDLGFRD